MRRPENSATGRLPEEPGCIGLVAAGHGARQRAGGHRPRAVVMALRSGFHRFDLERGALQRLSEPLFDTTRYRFNDGTVDPDGRFWAGTLFEPKDEASGGLYCLERGQIPGGHRPRRGRGAVRATGA